MGRRVGIEQGDEWVINWLKNKMEHRQHLKEHQITFNPFADYPIDVNLFPADNFCILEELESQQAPLLLYPLFIEQEMREENGYKHTSVSKTFFLIGIITYMLLC